MLWRKTVQCDCTSHCSSCKIQHKKELPWIWVNTFINDPQFMHEMSTHIYEWIVTNDEALMWQRQFGDERMNSRPLRGLSCWGFSALYLRVCVGVHSCSLGHCGRLRAAKRDAHQLYLHTPPPRETRPVPVRQGGGEIGEEEVEVEEDEVRQWGVEGGGGRPDDGTEQMSHVCT